MVAFMLLLKCYWAGCTCDTCVCVCECFGCFVGLSKDVPLFDVAFRWSHRLLPPSLCELTAQASLQTARLRGSRSMLTAWNFRKWRGNGSEGKKKKSHTATFVVTKTFFLFDSLHVVALFGLIHGCWMLLPTTFRATPDLRDVMKTAVGRENFRGLKATHAAASVSRLERSLFSRARWGVYTCSWPTFRCVLFILLFGWFGAPKCWFVMLPTGRNRWPLAAVCIWTSATSRKYSL